MKKHKLTGNGGKGSARRESNEQAYRDNWDKIFGKTRANINTRSVGFESPTPPTAPNTPNEKQ